MSDSTKAVTSNNNEAHQVENTETDQKKPSKRKNLQASLLEKISGDVALARRIYSPALPSELVAGSIPHM